MTDLKLVDSAVVVASKHQPKKVPISFPVSTQIVQFNEETNSTIPPVNREVTSLFKCTDKKYAAVPHSALQKTKIAGVDDLTVFPFSSEVLVAVVHWCEKYGTEGSAESRFAHPVTHLEFESMLSTEWDKQFFERHLQRHDTTEVLIGVTNVAEKYSILGLLNFCVVAIGCAVRSATEEEILTLLHQSTSITAEEVSELPATYPWLKALTAPH